MHAEQTMNIPSNPVIILGQINDRCIGFRCLRRFYVEGAEGMIKSVNA
jgi:hypothetical protein